MDGKSSLLIGSIRAFSPVAVAFSGGVDSSVVAKAAYAANASSIAVLVEDPSVSQSELDIAKDVANSIGIKLIVKSLEKRSEDYLKNDSMRCYFCKSQVYEEVKKVADEHKIKNIMDGTNADDVKDFRPGMRAANELGVLSPLLDFGITKKQVREIAFELGLPNHDKPSNPCLSSRIAHGIRISSERLKRVEHAEAFIANLLDVRVLRVRDNDDTARIEAGKNELSKFSPDNMSIINSKLREMGFKSILLDPEGYRNKIE